MGRTRPAPNTAPLARRLPQSGASSSRLAKSSRASPAGHFVVDLSPLIWQWSLMARSKHRDARETHHTVSAGILDALGRGFLIATASVLAGLCFGTAHLAIGLWAIGLAAASGVGCMVGSALIRNAGCDRCEKKAGGSPRPLE